MATIDYTTFTETDPSNKLTVTSTKIDAAALPEEDIAHVVLDKGAGFFDGDFEHLLEGYVDAATVNGIHSGGWGVGDHANPETTDNTKGDSLFMKLQEESAVAIFTASEHDNSNTYQDTVSVNKDTLYYLKIVRDEAVGTYGTLYVYVYSDSGRTTLVDTASLALHTSKKDFRYLYGWLNYANEVGAYTFTGYVQNLDIQEAAATSIKTINGITQANVKTVDSITNANIKSVSGISNTS